MDGIERVLYKARWMLVSIISPCVIYSFIGKDRAIWVYILASFFCVSVSFILEKSKEAANSKKIKFFVFLSLAFNVLLVVILNMKVSEFISMGLIFAIFFLVFIINYIFD